MSEWACGGAQDKGGIPILHPPIWLLSIWLSIHPSIYFFQRVFAGAPIALGTSRVNRVTLKSLEGKEALKSQLHREQGVSR